ncbi:MAG TPA: DNA/RNA non-specific endonuclease [Gemmatimonadaceae bacterium]|nr:DNA/RNA non-specific endonuclease [Gemmatimonadaceae bacterium]
MRFFLRGAAVPAVAVLLASCSDGGVLAPLQGARPNLSVAAPAARPIHISEIHYDNAGTDAGEAVELTGPANADLTGWQVVLYNGTGGAPYNTTTLSGTLDAACGAEGTRVITYPSNGIQNGSPDGVALVNASGTVVEFLSYEGTFTAAGGPANGMTSTDIGVEETSSTPLGESLQRNGLDGWNAPAPSTFGACNDAPITYDGPTTVVIDELMGDPLAALSASWGEWFEVHNYGSEPVNLAGWTIRSGGDAPHRIAHDVIIAPGGWAVLGRSDNVANNGGAPVDYNYFTGGTTIWLDANDWLVLRSPAGATVDSVRWSDLPKGATRALRDPSTGDADVDGAGWGYSTTPFGSGDFGTPGEANGALSDVAPPIPTGVVRITFSGRDDSDPALPVGFEDQLFASAFDAAHQAVSTTFTWSSATPELASVDQNGVVHALGAGVAVIRVTAADGRVGLYRVPTRVAVASTTALYAGNTEFGVPTDADPSDDFLITRPEYTLSYSATRNTPNWVSYDLEATHFGPEDRCDCFTADPALPSSFAHLTTADYTGAGSYAGYGIDRGHLVRSADRTSASLDNAYTFYLSNIIPQAADLNQGPWAVLENYLGDLARDGTREVYVIAGVAGNIGTLKGEGKVVIPAHVWKVAVIMPRDEGLADVHAPGDVQIVAVDMPNQAGVRNVDWQTYRTTVDAIEAEAGYDLLDKLPDDVEWLVEAGIASPQGASADRLLGILATGVQELATRGVVAAGEGNALEATLSAARQQLESGNAHGARGPLGAFRNQVEALVRSGRLTAAEGASLETLAGWVMDDIG